MIEFGSDTVRPTVAHADSCEAEPGHAHDCATATRLARLTAFAEAVRDEIECTESYTPEADLPDDHVDDCFHHAAVEALEPVR